MIHQAKSPQLLDEQIFSERIASAICYCEGFRTCRDSLTMSFGREKAMRN